MTITKEQLMEIFEIYKKAKEESGRKIKTAILIDKDDVEIIHDEREDEDIN